MCKFTFDPKRINEEITRKISSVTMGDIKHALIEVKLTSSSQLFLDIVDQGNTENIFTNVAKDGIETNLAFFKSSKMEKKKPQANKITIIGRYGNMQRLRQRNWRPVSIYTHKCSNNIQPHRASDLRQQCTTFVRGLCANRVDC
jgi:hypothetical protein